jgi:hypothetical protein
MKQIAKMTFVLTALLAVSACSMTSEDDVYSDYDYGAEAAGDNVLVTDLMHY